jgi:hypothetical protein
MQFFGYSNNQREATLLQNVKYSGFWGEDFYVNCP